MEAFNLQLYPMLDVRGKAVAERAHIGEIDVR